MIAGEYVKVTEHLKGTRTEAVYHVVEKMWNMAGKIFKIKSASDRYVVLYSEEASRTYKFHKDDVELVEPIDSSKLFIEDKKDNYMFDVEQL